MSFTVDHEAVSSSDSTEGSTCATHTSLSLDSCERSASTGTRSASTSTHFVAEPPPLVHVGVSDRFEGVASDNQLTDTVQFKDLLLQRRHTVIDVTLQVLHLSIQLGQGFGLAMPCQHRLVSRFGPSSLSSNLVALFCFFTSGGIHFCVWKG